MGSHKELLKRTRAARDEAFALYLGGMRQCDIARKLKRSPQRTRQLLAKAIRERGLLDRQCEHGHFRMSTPEQLRLAMADRFG